MPQGDAQLDRIPDIDPAWRLTAGRWAAPGGPRDGPGARARLPVLPEWRTTPALLRRERWPGFAEALRLLHAPPAPPVGELTETPPRRRLAYDELLADQVATALMRGRAGAACGPDDR